ncbi:DUF2163 domain-containing protein [Oricola thermophila]|uniref:DUF2163 domain-containing protein n=1 Tax=Oricola thermophila TaxID=2742145 RepID=A0A6N1VA87_9HYPH|nr:DUF2163 domain-containing protein [Oricola thermophila]QKV17860.1 DUF2163 domain-containing protein [Oricola thermophila]
MRNYPTAVLAMLDEGRTAIAGMIRFDLGEGPFGIIQAVSPYEWGGITYHPFPAGIISISDIPGTTGTAAQGFTITLSESSDDGLTPQVILDIESYDYRDRPVTIYDLHTHPDTGVPLGDPIAMMRGYINAISHAEEPDTGHIATIECESRAIDYSRTNGRIRSDDDQKRRNPGDRFFEHAATTGRVKVKWGKD